MGVTEDKIVVSVSMPFSQPGAGAFYEDYWNGAIRTWEEDVNANGGIHGRELEVKKVDNKGTTDGSIAACKEIQSNGSFVSLAISGTDAQTTCLDDAGRSELNGTLMGSSPGWRHSKGITFIPGTGARAAEFLRELGWADTKVGVIWVEDALRTAVQKGFFKRASEIGLDVVGVERAQTHQSSYVPELSRLRSAGTETLVMLATLEVLTMYRDLRSMGWDPNTTGAFWADELTQAGHEFMEGVRITRPWTTSESEAFKRFEAKVEKYGTRDNPTTTDMYMHGYALVLGRVLEMAGPNLTQENFETAMNSIENYTAEGILPSISTSPNRPFGSEGVFPIVCCNPDRTWKGDGPARNRF